MAYVREVTKTLTVTTGSTSNNGNSTEDLNGLIQSVYISVSKSTMPEVAIVSADSTARSILTVADPSTLGAWYYPRALENDTTGGTLPSSGGTKIPLNNELFKVTAQSSSGISGTVTVTVSVV
jgi:hypothetical protein